MNSKQRYRERNMAKEKRMRKKKSKRTKKKEIYYELNMSGNGPVI